jgi:hypothetical protein
MAGAAMKRFQFRSKESLVPEEQEHASHMEELLFELSSHANDFGSAASLLDFCLQQERTPISEDIAGRSYWWKFVGGRDGAMCLYHFWMTLETIRGSMHLIPTFKPSINHPLLRSCDRSFRDHFPDFYPMRTAIAHLGEIGNTLDKRKGNSVDGYRIYQSFHAATFLMTFEGQTIKYNLTLLSYQRLLKIVDDSFAAFAAVGDAVELQSASQAK